MSWDGLLLVNKPWGETSHTVVQRIKTRVQVPRAGHLGTLDPIATGVFPVCLGKATRLAPFYMNADKCYLTAIRFGFFTTTDDREGDQDGPFQKVLFSRSALEEAVLSFQGEYVQKPPSFSAKKIKGQRAYRMARRGENPELPSQKVRIYETRLLDFQKDVAIIFIHCASGTYVRSMARELGVRLKCGAHVKELQRTKFNQFSIEQCCAPDATKVDFESSFIPLAKMLPDYPEITADTDQSKKVLSGSAIDIDGRLESEWVKVFDQQKTLLAFARLEHLEKTRLHPKIVFQEGRK